MAQSNYKWYIQEEGRAYELGLYIIVAVDFILPRKSTGNLADVIF